MRWLPYVLPYAVFAGLPLLGDVLPEAAGPWLDPVRAALAAGLLVVFAARGAYPELLRQTPRQGVGAGAALLVAVLVGVACGAVWVPLSEWVVMAGGRGGFDTDAPAFGVRLACRLAGSLAVIPVAEELLVRSFVPRLADASAGGPAWHEREVGRFSTLSFGVSVLFFTITHPEWLAAFVVGIALAALLAWTRRLRDVVLAHAVANAMLAAWVIPNQAWHLW